MIGIDTNVLARFIMQDDPVQARRSTRFLASLTPETPGHVSTVALAELNWVLSQTYGASRPEIASAIRGLLSARSIVIERASCVDRALAVLDAGKADFADALISEIDREVGCGETVTFDKGAAKHTGMRLLT